jgi:hypothetical protein
VVLSYEPSRSIDIHVASLGRRFPIPTAPRLQYQDRDLAISHAPEHLEARELPDESCPETLALAPFRGSDAHGKAPAFQLDLGARVGLQVEPPRWGTIQACVPGGDHQDIAVAEVGNWCGVTAPSPPAHRREDENRLPAGEQQGTADAAAA